MVIEHTREELRSEKLHDLGWKHIIRGSILYRLDFDCWDRAVMLTTTRLPHYVTRIMSGGTSEYGLTQVFRFD